MDGTDFSTRSSRYGYQCDVRQTYAGLPCQPFWTWVTGKSLWKGAPKAARETWLHEWQLWCQLAWSWSLIIGSVVAASALYHADCNPWLKLPGYVVAWVLVTNRTRGLLHTFHYTNHGATLANMRRAKWIGTWFMSIPILHTSWRNYHELHAETHHSLNDLCTERDPDQQFMTAHGFYRGMPEWEYWARLVYAPLLPKNLWGHLWFRLSQNFIKPEPQEIVFRVGYWIVFFTLAWYFHVLTELALFYFFPLIVLTQHSSWIQHTTEHLWFPDCPEDTSRFVAMGALTWGRFLGRPYPGPGRGVRHVLARGKWWAAVVLADIPMRLYSFMQDLPSHDFHHRAPRVNFWHIAPERAANEGLPSKYGPMTETWGIWESWLVLRDHLCRGEHDPFAVYEWDRQSRAAIATAHMAPRQAAR